MATVTRGFSFTSTEQVTAAKLHTLVDSATISSIVAADISNGVITAAKLATGAEGNFLKSGDWIISSVTTARTGWTNVSATYADKFMRINATPLTTGGVDTHTHAAGSYAGPSHTHSAVTTSVTSETKKGLGLAVYSSAGSLWSYEEGVGTGTVTDAVSATSSASGTGAITGTSASANNIPAFVQVVIFQKD